MFRGNSQDALVVEHRRLSQEHSSLQLTLFAHQPSSATTFHFLPFSVMFPESGADELRSTFRGLRAFGPFQEFSSLAQGQKGLDFKDPLSA